ncbi:Formate channel 1 [Limihaloglobus sulfuriphilus]|uniref:Formate channel 1 n=1 Tax=Limihaloglobus sulfuriphilus TaxID=1851148 RepID=A0A1Q2MCF9_9BACT|nr:formate/nitrite transporter family protein [Limihaloglobus sulfuriphilus]AQQ69977.1 Formate channel 1 [Limihaloglobus sulfuriphilus]
MEEQNSKENARAAHTTLATGKYDPKLSLKELSSAISKLGIKKANTRTWQLLLLGVLAGLYISLGSQLFIAALAQGHSKVVGGALFSLGLVFVLIAGAELFTGNIIMLVGTLTHLFAVKKLIRNWIGVYAGNFIGSVLTAVLIWQSGLMGNSAQLTQAGEIAVKIAEAKISLPFMECLIRGFFCNMLVILAIIMATMSRDIISKIVCCIFPIMAFVACGFEHCVANMYLIPIGLLAKGTPILEQGIMFKNILPVTIGNILGGIFILMIHPNRIRQFKFLITEFKQRHKSNSSS